MRAAQINNGVVVNIIEVADLAVLPGLVAAPSANIGDTWDGTAFASPAQAGPRVPLQVPMLDARLTLIGAGKMAAVQAYLDAIPGIEGEQAREYFVSALTMKRHHPLVHAIPPAIMTEAEKDALFIVAGGINA